ncbi:MAG: preprotein translocase subunit YajC [Treponema sp.]|uniref:preprotein translocase subunit YajC n=1 Tax=Treponema sp. TaxID=166 RepID=UPI003FA20AA4
MYSVTLLQAAATPQGSMLSMFLPLALIFVIFYIFIIRPQNKKQKETQKMIDALKKGDKIVTIGGIHGTISSTKEQTVIVKVDENTKIEFSRSAIASVITDKAETASGTEKAGAASEEKGEKKSLFGKIKKDNKKAEESSSEK